MGCEEPYYRGFSIGLRRQPDPKGAARKVAAWKKKQEEAWNESALEFAEDMPTVRVVTAQPWRHVWKKAEPGWASDPWKLEPASWARSGRRIVFEVGFRPPVILPKRVALSDIVTHFIALEGTVLFLAPRLIKCPTFAHALPMGWTTKAIREPARVLGPHQTWPYMHHAPLRQTAERYGRAEEALARWEFNYRRWEHRGLPSKALKVLRAVACESMPIDSIDLKKLKSALKAILVKKAPIKPNMV